MADKINHGFVSDKLLFANEFVEYYTGLYFFHCDTLKEAKNCLSSENIWIGDGYELTEIDGIKLSDGYFVLVEFSTDDGFTRHEIRIMRVQKKYLKRFLKNMEICTDAYPDF